LNFEHLRVDGKNIVSLPTQGTEFLASGYESILTKLQIVISRRFARRASLLTIGHVAENTYAFLHDFDRETFHAFLHSRATELQWRRITFIQIWTLS